jgi:hypothetical protein
MSCQETTEANTEKTEPDPGTMQSMEEHQEIPKDLVGGLRRQQRDQNLATGRRQKPMGRIQASCESRRRSTITGRRMTLCATVVWHKKNIFRKIGTQENCGPHKEFATAGIRMIHCAGVAWLRRGIVRKDCTRAKDE